MSDYFRSTAVNMNANGTVTPVITPVITVPAVIWTVPPPPSNDNQRSFVLLPSNYGPIDNPVHNDLCYRFTRDLAVSPAGPVPCQFLCAVREEPRFLADQRVLNGEDQRANQPRGLFHAQLDPVIPFNEMAQNLNRHSTTLKDANNSGVNNTAKLPSSRRPTETNDTIGRNFATVPPRTNESSSSRVVSGDPAVPCSNSVAKLATPGPSKATLQHNEQKIPESRLVLEEIQYHYCRIKGIPFDPTGPNTVAEYKRVQRSLGNGIRLPKLTLLPTKEEQRAARARALNNPIDPKQILRFPKLTYIPRFRRKITAACNTKTEDALTVANRELRRLKNTPTPTKPRRRTAVRRHDLDRESCSSAVKNEEMDQE